MQSATKITNMFHILCIIFIGCSTIYKF